VGGYRGPTLLNVERDELPDPIVRLYIREDTFLAVSRAPVVFPTTMSVPWGEGNDEGPEEPQLAPCWYHLEAELEEQHHAAPDR